MKMDIFKIIAVFCLAVFLSGCAKTMTERIPSGSRIVVSVNFGSNLKYSDNKYYMVISSRDEYLLPQYPYEFLEPGDHSENPGIDYFDFYKTWAGYVVVNHGMVYLVAGPFVSTTETYTPVQVGGPLSDGRNINFQFSLEALFGPVLPDVIYFDLVSTDSGKILRDHLTPPSKSIMSLDGMIVSGSDEADPEPVDPSLNILDWSISIQ